MLSGALYLPNECIECRTMSYTLVHNTTGSHDAVASLEGTILRAAGQWIQNPISGSQPNRKKKGKNASEGRSYLL